MNKLKSVYVNSIKSDEGKTSRKSLKTKDLSMSYVDYKLIKFSCCLRSETFDTVI